MFALKRTARWINTALLIHPLNWYKLELNKGDSMGPCCTVSLETVMVFMVSFFVSCSFQGVVILFYHLLSVRPGREQFFPLILINLLG